MVRTSSIGFDANYLICRARCQPLGWSSSLMLNSIDDLSQRPSGRNLTGDHVRTDLLYVLCHPRYILPLPRTSYDLTMASVQAGEAPQFHNQTQPAPQAWAMLT